MNTGKSSQIKSRVTITIATTEMPDGTWSTSLTVNNLDNQRMADLAAIHMQKLFCGEEIKLQS